MLCSEATEEMIRSNINEIVQESFLFNAIFETTKSEILMHCKINNYWIEMIEAKTSNIPEMM